MFGYININASELDETSKKNYQSYYCGLCRRLKKNCGTRGQMLLNYDMTFLVVLLTGLYELPCESAKITCALHPASKRQVSCNEITDYAAEMNVILAYYNLIDDWKDDNSYPKKAFAKMLQGDYTRIMQKYPRQVQAVENYMSRMEEIERRRETNLDIAAGVTGEMLGEIFCWREDEWARELRTMGFYMGKFIYLMDACEDYEKDTKNNSYNPLLYMGKSSEEERETFCKLLLTSMMAECAKSFERLPILQHADILRNILYSGVWTKYEYNRLKKEKRQSRVKQKENKRADRRADVR